VQAEFVQTQPSWNIVVEDSLHVGQLRFANLSSNVSPWFKILVGVFALSP
jgi:hypothetical protein